MASTAQFLQLVDSHKFFTASHLKDTFNGTSRSTIMKFHIRSLFSFIANYSNFDSRDGEKGSHKKRKRENYMIKEGSISTCEEQNHALFRKPPETKAKSKGKAIYILRSIFLCLHLSTVVRHAECWCFYAKITLTFFAFSSSMLRGFAIKNFLVD